MQNKTPALLIKNWPNTPKKGKRMKKELNQAEIQYLIAINRDGLTILQSQIEQAKDFAATMWNDCKPDDPSTLHYYTKLNETKAWLESAQRHYKTLSRVQSKLKTMR